MTLLSTLCTPHKLSVLLVVSGLLALRIIVQMPNFEASVVAVPRHITLLTHGHILWIAHGSQVAYFIALKAEFFRALEWVVSVLAAKDAVEALALIRTVSLEVTKLFAVAALDSWVFICKVTRYLSFQLLKFVFLRIWLFSNTQFFHFTIFDLVIYICYWCFTKLLFKILVALKGTTWNEHIRVELCDEAWNVWYLLLLLFKREFQGLTVDFEVVGGCRIFSRLPWGFFGTPIFWSVTILD